MEHCDADGLALQFEPADFFYLGRTIAGTHGPELFLYSYEPEARRGFAPLALDASARPFVTRPDRRYRHGFRWTRVSPFYALARAGIYPRPLAEVAFNGGGHPKRDSSTTLGSTGVRCA